MVIIPVTDWLTEQRAALRIALARRDIATASRIADAILAYVGKGVQ